MTYSSTSARAFREKSGSLSQKLATELGLIATELDGVNREATAYTITKATITLAASTALNLNGAYCAFEGVAGATGRITPAAAATTMTGGSTSGDALVLQGSSANAGDKITITGNTGITIAATGDIALNPAGADITIGGVAGGAGKLTIGGTSLTVYGGDTTGDSLVLQGSSADASQKITILGNSGTTILGAVKLDGTVTLDDDATLADASNILTITQNTIKLVGDTAITLDGDVTVNAAHTFATGTGAATLNGDTTIATTKKLYFNDTGTYIHSPSDGKLEIVADSDGVYITVPGSAANGVVIGGTPDWGAGTAGPDMDGTGFDWALSNIARVTTENATATAYAAQYNAFTLAASQNLAGSAFVLWNEMYISDSVALTGFANVASVWGQVEAGTGVTGPDLAHGDFMAAGYFNFKTGDSFTTGSFVNGVRVQSEVSTTDYTATGSTWMAGLEVLTKSGYQNWTYGLRISGADTGIYLDPTGCTSGIQIGAAALTGGSGMAPALSAPVGFYFDDNGGAITAYRECFNVGLLLVTANTGEAQTGMPSAQHVYIDQRANMTAHVDRSISALWASYLVRNNSTVDGFDNGTVAAIQSSLDVDTGSTLAAGTTMAGISFGGNLKGTISGSVFPIVVDNYGTGNVTGFMKLGDTGTYQGAAATGGTSQYLKVYIGSTLYTIEMTTAA